MKTWALLIVLAASSAMAAESTTRPEVSAAAPATRPSVAAPQYDSNRSYRRNQRRSEPAQPNLPTIYEEVGARNIFVKGNQRPPRQDNPGSPGPIIPSATQLVLTGVSVADNGKLGFLEDQQASTVTRVKVGDAIAAGKVVNITLDSLDYQDANGKIVRVYVGYNLAGGDVWGVANAGATTQASTQPQRTGPRGPNESMEDYLRRRRAAETGR
ncbi:MAG: hypothetical protein ABSH08_02545 [Tepidisphaeraceae bacterium]|jgi:hypothetical protein